MTQARTDMVTVDKARSGEACLKVLSMLSGQDPPFQVAEAVAGTIMALLGLIRPDMWHADENFESQLQQFVFNLSVFVSTYDFRPPTGDPNGTPRTES